jgi:zeta-carotene desaturase
VAGRIAIIGGGFSGLAAAVALSERGHHVIVLEKRPHLGGRAYSFIDSTTGDVVDNGQHLFMACYSNTIAFLERIGCLDRLQFQPRAAVEFVDTALGTTRFACPPLPAPLHVLGGLARLGGLSLREKLAALRVGFALRRNGSCEDRTVSQWFDRLGQSDTIRKRFWNPIATATLNEDPAIASAKMMKVVLQLAFGQRASDSRIGVARVGLTELYATGARAFVETRGGEVRTRCAVRQLNIASNRVETVDLSTGERIEADCFISAVPHNAFLHFLPTHYRRGEFANVARLGSSPIISINLWFDRPVTASKFVGLLGTNIQWLFNKNAIFSVERDSHQVALVISAARQFIDMSSAKIGELALDEVRALFPLARSARVVHKRVIKERDATLAHTVLSDSMRPGARTSLANLFLAGDWTDTGLPATIEGAVLSGYTAAAMADKTA